MNNKLIKMFIPGVIMVGIFLLIEGYGFFFCKNNLGCLGFTLLPLAPIIVLGNILNINIQGISLFVITGLFYLLIGFLLGFLLGLLKKEEVRNEDVKGRVFEKKK